MGDGFSPETSFPDLSMTLMQCYDNIYKIK